MPRALTVCVLLLAAIAGAVLAQSAAGAVQTGPSVIRIATANLLDFGYGESACKATRLESFAAVLADYDVVSCQEVMRASENGEACYACSGYVCHLDRLVQLMSTVNGADWRYRLNAPPPYRSRYEYYAVLYDASRVTYLGQEGSAASLPGSPAFLVRPPFWTSFRSGNFDFIVIDYHAPSAGSSVSPTGELLKLDAFLDVLQSTYPNERDLILAGDFNSDTLPLRSPWSSSCRGSIDFVAMDMASTAYELALPCGADARLQGLGLSDHPIVWAQFDTMKPDDD